MPLPTLASAEMAVYIHYLDSGAPLTISAQMPKKMLPIWRKGNDTFGTIIPTATSHGELQYDSTASGPARKVSFKTTSTIKKLVFLQITLVWKKV
jgi:hypothetical protein